MKIILQRVSEASITVDNKVINKIGNGLLVLVGFTPGDTIDDISYLVDKTLNLRIFNDENKVMNKSLIDIDGEILSISQFTLYANCTNGRRPSYDRALGANDAKIMYETFNNELLKKYPKIKTGIFQAEMKIELTNEGPVTIILESR